MSDSDRRPSPEQERRLAQIIDPQQREALLDAIAKGEDIPDYAWEPVPPGLDCEAVLGALERAMRNEADRRGMSLEEFRTWLSNGAEDPAAE